MKEKYVNRNISPCSFIFFKYLSDKLLLNLQQVSFLSLKISRQVEQGLVKIRIWHLDFRRILQTDDAAPYLVFIQVSEVSIFLLSQVIFH